LKAQRIYSIAWAYSLLFGLTAYCLGLQPKNQKNEKNELQNPPY